MQKEMTYMIVIKPSGELFVSVLDRGQVECSKVEGVAQTLGRVSSVERTEEDDPANLNSTIIPDDGGEQ